MAKVQHMVDSSKERALEVERTKKTAHVILTEVKMETKCLKEMLKVAKKKLASTKEKTWVAKEKVAKVDDEDIEQPCKVVEDF